MKSIRLLPVVIFAAFALLLFKGIGLVTNGGYVLTGASAVVANEGGGEGEEPTLQAPSETVLTDAAPMLGDEAPTMATSREPSEAPHIAESSAPASSEPEHEEPSSASAAMDGCGEPVPSVQPQGAELTDRIGKALANGCPPPEVTFNEHGDALPTTKDGNGKIVPLQIAEGDNSEQAIIERLGERRAELDRREADLDMRTALLQAAERKLDERAKALADLEAQVNALVDEKQVTEDTSFKAVVSMYETMKPRDAAKIFDTLDLPVLLRVARAMNPRKMAPVLALMEARKAEALTTAFATKGPTNTVADAGATAAELPQIVGQ